MADRFADQCRAAVRLLAGLHGLPKRRTGANDDNDVRASCGQTPSVIESLIRTLLSQNTTNKNSSAAMDGLLAQFGRDWDRLRRARPGTVAQAIQVGGLANVKAARIQRFLADVHRERGETSLEWIRALTDDEAMQALLAIDGVGPKTASCVLLFCLGRDRFAVDTHVLRICKRLGWLRPNATREQAFEQLDASVPADAKYPLHVLLVQHGKCCPECAARGRPQRAPVGPCPLAPLVAANRTRAGASPHSRTAARR